MFFRRLLLPLILLLPATAWPWEEQKVLDFILTHNPILRAYQVVIREYTPSSPMQRVLEHAQQFSF